VVFFAVRYYNFERLHTKNSDQLPVNYENSLKKCPLRVVHNKAGGPVINNKCIQRLKIILSVQLSGSCGINCMTRWLRLDITRT
jgi:hypothetical protein